MAACHSVPSSLRIVSGFIPPDRSGFLHITKLSRVCCSRILKKEGNLLLVADSVLSTTSMIGSTSDYRSSDWGGGQRGPRPHTVVVTVWLWRAAHDKLLTSIIHLLKDLVNILVMDVVLAVIVCCLWSNISKVNGIKPVWTVVVLMVCGRSHTGVIFDPTHDRVFFRTSWFDLADLSSLITGKAP